jgi:mannose-6-phosphate isomerase-like protein (cupin superfamily)
MSKKLDDVDYCKRPWGSWYVLERGDGYKVKKLSILPENSISLQYHNLRSEAWIVISGEGLLKINELGYKICAGDMHKIHVRDIHKVTNTSKDTPLVILELQQGHTCSEEDIVRL